MPHNAQVWKQLDPSKDPRAPNGMVKVEGLDFSSSLP